VIGGARCWLGSEHHQAGRSRPWSKNGSGVAFQCGARRIICTGETYKAVVKMTFAKGAALDDPSGLFNSSLEGNTRRAIDIREGDKINEKALKALIRAAVELNISVRATAALSALRKNQRALELRSWSRPRPSALAAAADALDLAVEGCVFLAERIVRVAQVLLVGHVAGARLAMANRRRYRRCASARIFRNGRRSLRKRVRATDQNHQCYREDRFPHPGSPFPFFYRVGASIVAQLRRPWAAQSCAFRTSAMVPSNQIPAATSTTKNPSITAFSTPRLPPSSGGSVFPSPSSVIARSRLWRIDMNVATIVHDTIPRFRG